MNIAREALTRAVNKALDEGGVAIICTSETEQALAYSAEEYWEYQRGYIGAEECAKRMRQYGVEVVALTLREARMRDANPVVRCNGAPYTLPAV